MSDETSTQQSQQSRRSRGSRKEEREQDVNKDGSQTEEKGGDEEGKRKGKDGEAALKGKEAEGGKDEEALSNLEGQLALDLLKEIEKIFIEADDDDEPGLDMEEFRNAMKQIMGDKEDDEFDKIFMKVDTNCDGTVDWEEYLSYMLLEIQAGAQMSAEEEKIFPDFGQFPESNHNDSIVKLQYFNPIVDRAPPVAYTSLNTVNKIRKSLRGDRNYGRYLSASAEGLINLWDITLQRPIKSLRTVSKYCRTLIVTSAVVVPKFELLFVATTSMSLITYQITDDEFNYLIEITKLPQCAVQMTYHTEYNLTSGTIFGGTDRGGIISLSWAVNPMLTIFNTKIITNTETDRIIFDKMIEGKYDHISAHFLRKVHQDSINAIVYLAHTEQCLTCCDDSSNTMCISDHPSGIRKMYFNVNSGITCLDYSKTLQFIVTGSPDTIVRVWNESINTKPIMTLMGHQSPIMAVKLLHMKEQVISVDKGPEVRLYCLSSQTALQIIDRGVLKQVGDRPITAAHYHPVLKRLIVATDTMGFIDKGQQLMDEQYMFTHNTEVSFVRYNPLFEQIISAGRDSLICVWDLYKGDKVIQFKSHSVRELGEVKDYEITAINFDPTFRRLLTAGRDGAVKLWNFNNGRLLRELPTFSKYEVSCVAIHIHQIFAGGWNREISVYEDDEDDEEVQFLSPKHSEDVTSIAFHEEARVFVTACYNGDMYLWATRSLRMLSVMNHTLSNRQLPAYQYKGKDRPPKLSFMQARKSIAECESASNQRRKSCRVSQPALDSILNIAEESRKMTEQCLKAGTSAVIKIVILDRPVSANSVSLLTACADGYVRAWSLHFKGGLLGQFYAGQVENQGLADIVLSSEEDLVITADIEGYVKVFCIDHWLIEDEECTDECLTRFQHYTYWKLKTLLLKFGKEDVLPCYPDPPNLHLITAFRGHMTAITAIDFINIGSKSCIVTGSLDQSVRVWTIEGQFVGLCGQAHLWNIVSVSTPIWRDEEYRFKKPESLVLKSNDMIPEDLIKGCDMQSIYVLKQGKFRKWHNLMHKLRMILIRLRAHEILRCEGEFVQEGQRSGRLRQTSFDGSFKDEEKPPVLGKYFVPPNRGRRRAELLNIPTAKAHVACFRCLPIASFYRAPHPMSHQVLRQTRKAFDLQPLEENRGIGKVFQKTILATRLIANASLQKSGRVTSSLRQSIDFPVVSALADLKCTLNRMRRRAKAIGTPLTWRQLISIAQETVEQKKKRRGKKAKTPGYMMARKSTGPLAKNASGESGKSRKEDGQGKRSLQMDSQPSVQSQKGGQKKKSSRSKKKSGKTKDDISQTELVKKRSNKDKTVKMATDQGEDDNQSRNNMRRFPADDDWNNNYSSSFPASHCGSSMSGFGDSDLYDDIAYDSVRMDLLDELDLGNGDIDQQYSVFQTYMDKLKHIDSDFLPRCSLDGEDDLNIDELWEAHLLKGLSNADMLTDNFSSESFLENYNFNNNNQGDEPKISWGQTPFGEDDRDLISPFCWHSFKVDPENETQHCSKKSENTLSPSDKCDQSQDIVEKRTLQHLMRNEVKQFDSGKGEPGEKLYERFLKLKKDSKDSYSAQVTQPKVVSRIPRNIELSQLTTKGKTGKEERVMRVSAEDSFNRIGGASDYQIKACEEKKKPDEDLHRYVNKRRLYRKATVAPTENGQIHGGSLENGEVGKYRNEKNGLNLGQTSEDKPNQSQGRVKRVTFATHISQSEDFTSGNNLPDNHIEPSRSENQDIGQAFVHERLEKLSQTVSDRQLSPIIEEKEAVVLPKLETVYAHKNEASQESTVMPSSNSDVMSYPKFSAAQALGKQKYNVNIYTGLPTWEPKKSNMDKPHRANSSYSIALAPTPSRSLPAAMLGTKLKSADQRKASDKYLTKSLPTDPPPIHEKLRTRFLSGTETTFGLKPNKKDKETSYFPPI